MKDIEIRIKELEDELKELREEAEIQDKQGELKPWKPEHGEKYFYIRDTLEIGSFFNWDGSIDDKRIKAGNCFLTKERAEQVAKKMRLLLRLEQLHDMLCPDYVPDWENYGQKFLVYFNHAENQWTIGAYNAFEMRCETYFDTNENAKKAVEILNGELKRNKK